MLQRRKNQYKTTVAKLFSKIDHTIKLIGAKVNDGLMTRDEFYKEMKRIQDFNELGIKVSGNIRTIVDSPLQCVLGTVHKNIERKNRCSACKNYNIGDNVLSENKNKTTACPKCGVMKREKDLKYHNCSYNFAAIEDSAFVGDAMHRSDVVQFLHRMNYKKECSSLELNWFVQDYYQNMYADMVGLINYKELRQQGFGDHKISAIFEHNYYNDPKFRSSYLKVALSVECNLILKSKGKFHIL